MADYRNSNPFRQLEQTEIVDIKQHLHYYHGFDLNGELNMDTLSPYLLRVLDKVSSNLECYINYLENDRVNSIQNLWQKKDYRKVKAITHLSADEFVTGYTI